MKTVQQYIGETLTELELLGYDVIEVVDGTWAIESKGTELLQISKEGIIAFNWSYNLMTLALSLTKYDMHKKHEYLFIPISKYIELHYGVILTTADKL